MVEVALMIEGQDGLTWLRWQRILGVADILGFNAVFRSDHFTNTQAPDKPALELWASLTYAASHTTTIQFGPLVTPITFRHPSITTKAAAAVHDLSGGRLVLGMGAGWQDREHHNFGIPFPPMKQRFDMLRDGLEVVTRLMRNDEPSSYQGAHFQLDDAVLLPRPQPSGGPPILIGGNGPTRTLPLAARYADEWNGLFVSADRYRELNGILDGLLDSAGRSRQAVKRSIMLGTVYTETEDALQERLTQRGLTREEANRRGMIVGPVKTWPDQLRPYAMAGVQRVMLQWLEQDNIAGIEAVANVVIPALR